MEALEQHIDLLESLIWRTRKARAAIDDLRVDITREELDGALSLLNVRLDEAVNKYEEAQS